jgi:hypothetical protein
VEIELGMENGDEYHGYMLTDARQRYQLSCFKLEFLIVGCWSIWNHMNIFIFDNKQINMDECMCFFLEAFELVRNRAKPGLRACLSGRILCNFISELFVHMIL